MKNKEEAEDVLQESIIHGFSKLNELQDAARYVGWQKQIAVRNALNRLRKKNIFRSLHEHEDFINEEDCEMDNININTDVIQHSIDQLPNGYRIIVQLYLMEEMSHEEIGNELGITASTSRSQYSRALHKLKRELKIENEKQF